MDPPPSHARPLHAASQRWLLVSQEVGVFNGGYWGVNIAPHGIYRVSLYLKAANETVRRMHVAPFTLYVAPNGRLRRKF
jgi:hypothetical protein